MAEILPWVTDCNMTGRIGCAGAGAISPKGMGAPLGSPARAATRGIEGVAKVGAGCSGAPEAG